MNISSSPLINAYQGVQNGFQQLDQHSQKLASPSINNQTDKAEELVNMKQTEQQTLASLKGVKSADNVLGTIIDIMA